MVWTCAEGWYINWTEDVKEGAARKKTGRPRRASVGEEDVRDDALL